MLSFSSCLSIITRVGDQAGVLLHGQMCLLVPAQVFQLACSWEAHDCSSVQRSDNTLPPQAHHEAACTRLQPEADTALTHVHAEGGT